MFPTAVFYKPTDNHIICTSILFILQLLRSFTALTLLITITKFRSSRVSYCPLAPHVHNQITHSQSQQIYSYGPFHVQLQNLENMHTLCHQLPSFCQIFHEHLSEGHFCSFKDYNFLTEIAKSAIYASLPISGLFQTS